MCEPEARAAQLQPTVARSQEIVSKGNIPICLLPAIINENSATEYLLTCCKNPRENLPYVQTLVEERWVWGSSFGQEILKRCNIYIYVLSSWRRWEVFG